MKYCFTITETVYHRIWIEADDSLTACQMVQEEMDAGNFGDYIEAVVDFDYDYDSMREVNNA